MHDLTLKQSSLIVTLNCNLKCRLCAAFSPYYEKPPLFSIEQLKKSIEQYFQIVSKVKLFSLSGGEPLTYPYLAEIICFFERYIERFETLEIITNGSMALNRDTLDAVVNLRDKTFFLVDDYGSTLSTKVEDISFQLKNHGIRYSVRNYTQRNPHCGGWVDFGNHTKKHYSLEDTQAKFRKCAYSGKLGFCHAILHGKIYLCKKSQRLEELGIQKRRPEEYLDLFDASLSIEQKKERFRSFDKLTYLEACAYCNGLCEDSERFVPAEQMEKEKEYESR